MSEKLDFKAKNIEKDKERHFTMKKRVIPSRGHNNPEVYVPPNRVSKYMK